MKKVIFSTALAMAALVLASCEKESEGLTRTTYYPILQITGGPYIMSIGDDYVEQGCKATLNGEDVSDQVVISDNIDNSEFGAYEVKYTIVNSDGFASNATRKVFVTNGSEFSNFYLAESQFGSRHYFDAPIAVVDNGDGTYTIDDILGGFYAYGRYPGYPYDFLADAVIKKEADNSITLVSVGDWYFAEDPISIVSGEFDPANCSITLNLDFAGDPFYVSLVVPSNE